MGNRPSRRRNSAGPSSSSRSVVDSVRQQAALRRLVQHSRNVDTPTQSTQPTNSSQRSLHGPNTSPIRSPTELLGRVRANTCEETPILHFASLTGIYKDCNWPSTTIRTLIVQYKLCPCFPPLDQLQFELFSLDQTESSSLNSIKELKHDEIKAGNKDLRTKFACKSNDTMSDDGSKQSGKQEDVTQEASKNTSNNTSNTTNVSDSDSKKTEKQNNEKKKLTTNVTTTNQIHESIEGVECPLCFNDFPCKLNRTACCRQEICTECFLNIQEPNYTQSCPFCMQERVRVNFNEAAEAKAIASQLVNRIRAQRTHPTASAGGQPSADTSKHSTDKSWNSSSVQTSSVSQRRELAAEISRQHTSPEVTPTQQSDPITRLRSILSQARQARSQSGTSHTRAVPIRDTFQDRLQIALRQREIQMMEELMIQQALRLSLDEAIQAHTDDTIPDASESTQSTVDTNTSIQSNTDLSVSNRATVARRAYAAAAMHGSTRSSGAASS